VNKFELVTKFIKNIYGEKEVIPLHQPLFIGNELDYLKECIDSTFVSSVGSFVDRFEKLIQEYTGAKKAIVCDSGTNALYISLLLSGVERGTEVITQPLTFVATVNAISYCGAFPVFVDVNKKTLGIDPEKLNHFLVENTVLKNEKCYNKLTGNIISACVIMHTFGHPSEILEIQKICNKFCLTLIEDSAESLGSKFHDQHTGTFGKFGILSFNGNKTITTGGGGMILTNDLLLGEKAKHITTQAKCAHEWEYFHDDIGYNYRMPNLNAALGCAQMENLDYYISEKRLIAEKYKHFFSEIGINFFVEQENCYSNYWLNSIFLKNREERDGFLVYTNRNGIKTRPAWRLMNKLKMFENALCGDLSNAIDIENTLVNLPSSVPNSKTV
jgi:perosamine synthetase